MKNEATLKFKNFTARPRSFWIHPKLARAGATPCCACPAEAVCLEISSVDAKPMSKNLKSRDLKSLNFKNGNATGAYYDAGYDIRFIAYCCSTCQSINFNADRDLNLNICHDINSSAEYDINLVKGHGMNPSMDYYDIRLGADRDINSGKHRAVNFKISNANLKTNLAVLKADLRTDFRL